MASRLRWVRWRRGERGAARLEVALSRRISSLERLYVVYNVGRIAADRLGLSAFLRRGCILRVVHRDVGAIPLYGGDTYDVFLKRRDPAVISFRVLEALIYLLERYGVEGASVTVDGRVDIFLAESRGISLERPPEGALSLRIIFPLFRRRIVVESGDLDVRELADALVEERIVGRPSISPGRWGLLDDRHLRYLSRAFVNYSLEELTEIVEAIRPSGGGLVLRAGVNLFPYGVDVRRWLAEFATSLLERRRVPRSVQGLVRHALERLEGEFRADEVAGVLREACYRLGVDPRPLEEVVPRRRIRFELWRRDLSDLFMGHYAGTCIALNARKVMHGYMFDPYTEFFRIYVGSRRVGHVKMFICRDRDGRLVLHVDYIGLSGGKFRKYHELLRRLSISAAVEYARRRGLDRVYAAKEVAPKLGCRLVKNELRKLGRAVYSQFLSGEKYLVWEALMPPAPQGLRAPPL
ncbi:MAG: hypothetical protein DRK00_08455 [Thermoprotei archaeon]|nr:MAG: hypothetical protein DRK00_08455 [Thermoprotei archaeon]